MLLFQAAGLKSTETSKRFLVVITDDEWDMNDLKLCPEISAKGNLDADAKKREIVKFAKDSFSSTFQALYSSDLWGSFLSGLVGKLAKVEIHRNSCMLCSG